MCACISVSEESTRTNFPLHMDCGGKKKKKKCWLDTILKVRLLSV